MPPLPKRKYPKSSQGMRRSHLKIDTPKLTPCPQCHTPRLPHHACPVCGTYRGREAIKIEGARLNE